jgi:hypothetical protein
MNYKNYTWTGDDFAMTHTAAASGTAIVPIEIEAVSMAEIHPHDQQRHEPLATVEGFTMAGAVVAYAAVRLIRQARGWASDPPTADSS